MADLTLRGVLANYTPYGERRIAISMAVKGKAFVGAALLLRQRGGYEYVVLHLLCQGIEILAKGELLFTDYRTDQPKLRSYGHNLVKLAEAIEKASGVRVLKPLVRNELEALSGLYAKHNLRYGSGYDLFVNPSTIQTDRVLSRLRALLKLAERSGATAHPAI